VKRDISHHGKPGEEENRMGKMDEGTIPRKGERNISAIRFGDAAKWRVKISPMDRSYQFFPILTEFLNGTLLQGHEDG
jgi:hypothetical protein